jgi:DNA helicase-2/ATP-dependent DNA helicase PcrA
MEWLYITYAQSRRLYGRETYPTASRFVRELPAERLQEVRMRANVSRPVSVRQPVSIDSGVGYRAGQRVSHAKFGEGVVLQMEGEGNNLRVQIQFSGVGAKWLMAVYANLQVL